MFCVCLWLQVIRHPMDLGTVSQRLRPGRYATPQQVLDDVQLVRWGFVWLV